MRHRRKLVTLVILLVALLTVACQGPEEGTTSTAFRFGAVLPLTGPGAALGSLIRRGIELGIQDVNIGGQSTLAVVFEDSRTQPAEGLTAFRRLVDFENIPVVVVAFSAINNAVAPIAEDSDALMIGITTSMPNLVEGRRHVIRLFPTATQWVEPVASHAVSQYSRIAIVFAEDEYGRSTFEAFRRRFEGEGRSVVFSDSFQPNETEFRSLVARMLDAEPDAIYLPGYGPGYIALINQIRERDSDVQILGDSPLANPPVYRAAGGAVEGVLVPGTPLDAGVAETPAQKAFLESYMAQFDEAPSINVTIGYDLVHLLHQAVLQTDQSPEQVRDFIVEHGPYAGITGEIRYDPTGESIIPVRLLRISGGRLVVVE